MCVTEEYAIMKLRMDKPMPIKIPIIKSFVIVMIKNVPSKTKYSLLETLERTSTSHSARRSKAMKIKVAAKKNSGTYSITLIGDMNNPSSEMITMKPTRREFVLVRYVKMV
mmetsp:Transcript_7295/g.13154  ORF Transcript_7295/g.13154 Transcript_7295/m.13154 type:complete len:111 (-) Transcript_7295:1730-2062(-)